MPNRLIPLHTYISVSLSLLKFNKVFFREQHYLSHCILLNLIYGRKSHPQKLEVPRSYPRLSVRLINLVNTKFSYKILYKNRKNGPLKYSKSLKTLSIVHRITRSSDSLTFFNPFSIFGQATCFNRFISLVVECSPMVWETFSSIPSRVIPNTLKMVLDASLLNTQQYKVRIKGKVKQSRKRISALLYTSV